MQKKIFYIILAAVAGVVIVALLWWWFLYRGPSQPPASSGTFGTAQNRGAGSSGGAGANGNIGRPLGSTSGAGASLPPGDYSLTTLAGQPLGTYTVIKSGQTTTYRLTSPNGTPVSLPPGTYTFTSANGSAGTYTVAPGSTGQPSEYTITPVGQGAGPGTTGGSTSTTSPGGSSTNGNGPGSVAQGTTTGIQGGTGPSGGSGALVPPTLGSPGTVSIPPQLTVGQYTVPGVDWLSGAPIITVGTGGTPGGTTGGTGGSGGTGGTTQGGSTPISSVSSPGTVFNPTPINQVANSNPTGSGILPNIGGSIGGTGSKGGLGLGGALVGAAVAGAASCGAAQLFNVSTVAAGAALGPTAGAATLAAGTASAAIRTPTSVQTIDLGDYVAQGSAVTGIGTILGGIKGGQQSDFSTNTFWSCLTRVVAKIALNQITNSVVNWINGGFNGSPSFVTNPTVFFSNIADQAAGQFIKGSALSFLCSPFQLQIRIAVAQSYANQYYGNMQCSLSGVINNVNNFMAGDFNAGGWGGLLAFTTVPTNNPFGAYAAASIGLSYSVNTALGEQQRELALGNGFLDFAKKQNCTTSATPPDASQSKSVSPLAGSSADTGTQLYQVCDLVHTTPGHVIADALGATENSTLNELDVAKSFDEIISALITQLMTRTLQEGLSNISGTNGYASAYYTQDQLQTMSSAQTLAQQLQGSTQIAQDYGGVEQGSISDIQAAQSQLNNLYNCWTSAAAANAGNTTKQSQAQAAAQSASTTIAQLNTQVDTFNNEITRANGAIILLQQLQSSALSAASTADVSTVTSQYQAAQAQGELITAADLTTAQQNRTTLQSQLAALNQQTAIGLQQCQAF